MKCAVITPVGPGHEKAVEQAKASVQAAIEHSKGPFSEVEHVIIDDSRGEMGRSKARNKAVRATDADWLFFLDADDLMAPGAFEGFREFSHLDAVWGSITEISAGHIAPRAGQLLQITNIGDLTGHDPYLTIQMGHFVRREIALATPFNEEIDCGEDFDYYLRVWERHQCAKVPRIFFINVRGNHSTGPRSANGRQWREAVERMIGKHRIIVPNFVAESEEVRRANLEANSSKGLPMLHIRQPHEGEWLVCAGGPSLAKQVREIKKAQKRGGVVVSMNGTHDYLISQGVTPDYFVMADPRQRNVRFVQKPKKGVVYLISADCHPDITEALKGHDCRLWFPMEYDHLRSLVPVQVGGGSTVGLRAISIGYVLGFRRYQLFGFDGCVTEKHHAYDQPENNGECTRPVSYDGQTFEMTNWHIAQAEDFEGFIRRYGHTFTMKIHGDGVIRAIRQRYINQAHGESHASE